MNKKKLSACKYFFLDTGILVDLLKIDISKSSQDVQDRIKLTNLFFDALSDPDIYGGKEKIFQVSAISLAEIFHIDAQHESLLKAILKLLGSNELEVYPFDETNAIYHNKSFGALLGNTQLDTLKKELNYPVGGAFSSIKDRIRKDIMIASTAKMYNTDVVLTSDSGFNTLCGKLELPCHLFTKDKSQFQMNKGETKIYDWN